MPTYRARIYVGPTLVDTMAELFRQAGLDIVCEGTSHVYVKTTAETVDHVGFSLQSKLQRQFSPENVSFSWVAASTHVIAEVS